MFYSDFLEDYDLQNCYAKVMRCRTVGTNELGYMLYVKTIELLKEHDNTLSTLEGTIPGKYRAVYIEQKFLFAWYFAL